MTSGNYNKFDAYIIDSDLDSRSKLKQVALTDFFLSLTPWIRFGRLPNSPLG